MSGMAWSENGHFSVERRRFVRLPKFRHWFLAILTKVPNRPGPPCNTSAGCRDDRAYAIRIVKEQRPRVLGEGIILDLGSECGRGFGQLEEERESGRAEELERSRKSEWPKWVCVRKTIC
jgi:hypothetical protein